MASPTQHLTGACGVLQHCDAVAVGPSTTNSRCSGGISREYEMDWTRFDTSGRTQLHPADRGGGASDLGKSPLHAQRCPGGATAMVWAVEEQQERVTAPLE